MSDCFWLSNILICESHIIIVLLKFFCFCSLQQTEESADVQDPVLVCRRGVCPANQGRIRSHTQYTGHKLLLHG